MGLCFTASANNKAAKGEGEAHHQPRLLHFGEGDEL